jgi:hypothetical protein
VQIIELEDGEFTSLQVIGMRDLDVAFANRPLIFLNACDVGPYRAIVDPASEDLQGVHRSWR